MLRTLLVLALFTSAARAAEPWADPKLPVTDGLELWLDAGKAQATKGKVAAWRDASGKKRDTSQLQADAQPALVKIGGAAVVRFDGDNDHLRFVGPKTQLPAFTAFVVVAPRANPGDFRGFLAFNAPNGRDYETGLTIDMGPGPTPRFAFANVEGRGFGGARNLMAGGNDFGRLSVLEVTGDAAAKVVRLAVDGKPTGSRPWSAAPPSMDEITVGARFYTNGPGEHIVRGPARCDIAEVLVFNRALSDDETKKVRDYLDAKHAQLKRDLPPEFTTGERLVPVSDPPPVQVLLPGFAVRELPIDITNVNNVKYRHDGVLVALCYNGDIWHLTDTNGDGVEDKAVRFFESKGRLRGPIGMALTPPGYPHGEGVLVASKGKVSLILPNEKEVIVADGWKEIAQNVDAVGVALDPKDGSVYFGRGTGDYANAYRFDKDGKAHYDVKGEYGTVIRVAPDFKSREVIATGVRFSIGLHFNRAGDLFASDQEGATWLPNGNPFDELLHIQKGRHYGFPPRHPKHLPDVIDEPSTFDYGPQHQSTCGFCFNEPVKKDGPTFGPMAWAGDVFMTGESRGKLYRTQLVKTAGGYVARNSLFACLSMLTTDCCVSPDGSLVVSCHSGGPDWGSGPAGKGKLFKIVYADRDHPQPVLVWPAGPREVRVEFDRPVDPQLLRDVLANTKLTAGKYVRAGDRFETLWPGYAVVQMEKAAPRFNVPVRSAQLTPDRRTLVLATDPMTAAVHYALTLPGMGRKTGTGELKQHTAIDLDFDVTGCEATWTKNGVEQWRGWLPHPDLDASPAFTAGSAPHEAMWESMKLPGDLRLSAQVDLSNMLRPEVQPGSRLDYEPTDQAVRLQLTATGTFALDIGSASLSKEAPADRPDTVSNLQLLPAGRDWLSIAASVRTPGNPVLRPSWSTREDRTPRPFALRRVFLPWADPKADAFGKEVALAPAKELDGGSWARGRKEFFGNDAACSKCHLVNGQGGLIGPDLTNLIHRDYASVLRDVTQPSFALNPDYIPQTISLHSGKQLLGVVRTIDGKLHVGDKDGQTIVIDKSDVETMKPSGVSIMPDDLLKKLGPDRSRDLLTFLLTSPPSMPRDYAGTEKRPKPRTVAEVNAVLAGSPNPPEKTRRIRVVVVAGAKDPGKGEHDYPAWLKAWSQLLSATDNIDVATAMEWPPKEEFQKADAMVFYQRGSWDAKRAAEIDAFLERGGGLTYIHWAVDGRDNTPDFAKRIGLAAHGGKIKFRHGPLDLTFNKEPRHPIARNIDKLALVDESYWQLTGELPKERVIAWGTEDKEPRPLFWTTEPRKGRVFVSIPGHYSWSFDDPLFRVLLLRGLAWTAREPVDRFNDLVWPGADVAK